jgi:hypothetical protein
VLGGSRFAFQGKFIVCHQAGVTKSFFRHRLLLYRHHILDVVGGVVIGFFEALIMALLWVGPDTAKSFVKWISDDRTSGSDAETI